MVSSAVESVTEVELAPVVESVAVIGSASVLVADSVSALVDSVSALVDSAAVDNVVVGSVTSGNKLNLEKSRQFTLKRTFFRYTALSEPVGTGV